MMPSIRSATVVLLAALGACAPAQTIPGSGAPVPVPSEGPAPPPAQVVPPTEVPDQWWLLDRTADRVPGVSVSRAYRELLAGRQPERTVVVAIIDSGVDIEHVDLRGNIWVNEKEIPGNGRDDDENGYVDDVHGWNFIGGPDGRHVNHDTYEVTRLYAAMRPIFEGARPDTLSASARAGYARFQEIQAEFEQERREAKEQLQQMRSIDAAVERFWSLLRTELGTDSLTVPAVRAMRATRPELRQAQQAFLQLAAQNVTPEVVKKQLEYVEGRVEYGLNPDFDPRPIVGDNYSDPHERGYGNPDVVGPSADHGTHVAGIIGAERGNGTVIDGIAPSVRLMVLRTVPNGDERDKDVANAIRYAAENGADIINMSFGKSHSPRKEVVDAAVRYADERGVLMVHAAGNEGADLDANRNFPTRVYEDGSSARHWIEVGASAWWAADSLAASFSNFGQRGVDVFAPGVGILSTVPGDEYERNDGTSMAAPVVAGVAALLMAYYPALTAAEVRRIVLESASPFPEQTVLLPGGSRRRVPFGSLSVTGGIVNAYSAVQMAEQLRRGAADLQPAAELEIKEIPTEIATEMQLQPAVR